MSVMCFPKQCAEDISVLWDYLSLDMRPVRSDVMMVFGSHDEHTAVRASELFREGFSDIVLFTGGLGKITEKIWHEPEAERFSKIAESMGVPSSAILKETGSCSTFENIVFSEKLLDEKGILCRSILAVDKPYKVRRTFLMLSDLSGDRSVCTASEDITWQDYLARYDESPFGVSRDDAVSLLTGEICRIIHLRGREYIPADIFCAYERLCSFGFDRYLV